MQNSLCNVINKESHCKEIANNPFEREHNDSWMVNNFFKNWTILTDFSPRYPPVIMVIIQFIFIWECNLKLSVAFITLYQIAIKLIVINIF